MHNDNDDVTPLLSLQNATPSGSLRSDSEDCDDVDCGVTHTRLYDDTQSNDDDDYSARADVLEVILGRVDQREDASYVNDGWMSV